MSVIDEKKLLALCVVWWQLGVAKIPNLNGGRGESQNPRSSWQQEFNIQALIYNKASKSTLWLTTGNQIHIWQQEVKLHTWQQGVKTHGWQQDIRIHSWYQGVQLHALADIWELKLCSADNTGSDRNFSDLKRLLAELHHLVALVVHLCHRLTLLLHSLANQKLV